ncbi:hypothetical protein [Staphylococcus warneri]|uniref:hypothetical protein n=1 Tax=Staphylococcus warneri TaxID=1292 RepID=UPI000D1F4CF4|nr:hypothetical protein [Staphylococcus warneri]PTI28129.1 hypothetical protein BU079_11550 [Staphylococcus warneri]
MKKILVIVSIFSILLVACSSSPTKKAEGKWQNENGDIITIKGESLKVTTDGETAEGSIKDDKDHKDLAKINLGGATGYLKVGKKAVYALEKPDEKPDDSEAKFEKIKQ